MSRHQEQQRSPRLAVTTLASGPGPGDDSSLCTCCLPANPLVLRPDLGQLPDGSAAWALCAFHLPEPTVYRAVASGTFEQAPGLRLSELGELVDAAGTVVAQVQQEGFQRLTPVDDDPPPEPEGGSGGGRALPVGGERPAVSATRVDLTQDEFYGRAGRAAASSREGR